MERNCIIPQHCHKEYILKIFHQTQLPAIQDIIILKKKITFNRDIVTLSVCFRATPMAYGGSQARDQLGAIAAGLHHNNARLEPHLRTTPQLMATPDP